MRSINWDPGKSTALRQERGLGFEEILVAIDEGGLLDILQHHNRSRYPNQKIFVVRILDYVYLVPFVESGEELFLKTVIPSRKATELYLGLR